MGEEVRDPGDELVADAVHVAGRGHDAAHVLVAELNTFLHLQSVIVFYAKESLEIYFYLKSIHFLFFLFSKTFYSFFSMSICRLSVNWHYTGNISG